MSAERHNQGKPRLSMVFDLPHALRGATEVLEFGMAKYSRGNFKLGLPWTEVADSLLRHLLAWQGGDDIDEESKLFHVDHIAVNALFLAEFFRSRPEFDDRVKAFPTLSWGPSTDHGELVAELAEHGKRYRITPYYDNWRADLYGNNGSLIAHLSVEPSLEKAMEVCECHLSRHPGLMKIAVDV
jgi:hypothetical protein